MAIVRPVVSCKIGSVADRDRNGSVEPTMSSYANMMSRYNIFVSLRMCWKFQLGIEIRSARRLLGSYAQWQESGTHREAKYFPLNFIDLYSRKKHLDGRYGC